MAQLMGGIHRDVTGRASEPMRFYLAVDRGLRSGNLDEVSLDRREILRLVRDGAEALLLMDREASR